MDKCSMVVARIVDNYDSSRHADKSDSDLKTVMERHSMDLTNFKGKLRKQSSTISLYSFCKEVELMLQAIWHSIILQLKFIYVTMVTLSILFLNLFPEYSVI